MTDKSAPNHAPDLTVFYDGACPLCRREIDFYKQRDGSADIHWQDVSACSAAAALPADLSREAALARFHVRRADGELLSGASAFAELWAKTPGFRWLGRLARRPRITRVLDKAYTVFLRFRPALQRMVA